MSSLPLEQQPPPPPMVVNQRAYASHTSGGSIGPVIAVLAVIAILGAIAGLVGRLCAGRSVFGRGHYDFEGWIERKCASCIDGRIDPPPPPPPHSSANVAAGGSIPIVIPVQVPPLEGKHQHQSAEHSTPAEAAEP
ncbi:hypothetical protein Taro_006221 [Colocasia esculenta]|uniref:Uncharacterized protein n=1 Tax=Colocasia esculenta TaxID=4460 RepID=A0A843TWD6_COLES|nr:hypothetical protein [Colocasia esculenta]